MSAREWAPGDVAIRESRVSGTSLAFYVAECERGSGEGWQQRPHWHFDDMRCGSGGAEPTVIYHPVAVIRYEDREQVERLLVTLLNQADPLHPDGSGIQAALREFDKPVPVKVEEPTGLGAVIEDAGGRRWVHLSGRWHHGPLAHSQVYADIDAVKVLSEGVQP